jgi:two-component system LytT family response regulator
MTEVLRVLVADDELLARRRVIRLLSAIDAIEVVGECESGDAVVTRVREGGVDVVLLDVQMPGLTGIEVAELLPDDGPMIVLCTAYAEHAVDAFDLGAIDYIVKPVEAARLKKAIDRVRVRRDGRRVETRSVEPARALERLAIPTRSGIVLLDPAAITHATLDGELVTIHSSEGAFLSDDPLADLLAQLPADRFERVHRRAIVNLEQVVRLEPLDSGGFLAHVRGGETVEVSRQSARELRRRLVPQGRVTNPTNRRGQEPSQHD